MQFVPIISYCAAIYYYTILIRSFVIQTCLALPAGMPPQHPFSNHSASSAVTTHRCTSCFAAAPFRTLQLHYCTCV